MPTISLAGTRASEQPIHRYSGSCCLASFSKKSGSSSLIASAQRTLLSKSSSSSGMTCSKSGKNLEGQTAHHEDGVFMAFGGRIVVAAAAKFIKAGAFVKTVSAMVGGAQFEKTLAALALRGLCQHELQQLPAKATPLAFAGNHNV